MLHSALMIDIARLDSGEAPTTPWLPRSTAPSPRIARSGPRQAFANTLGGTAVATWATACEHGRYGAVGANQRQRTLETRVNECVHEVSDDHRLLARLAAGDMTALEELYDRYSRVTFAVIIRIVADRQVAEDLLQEAMFQLWQHAGRYDGRAGGVRPWLLAIAHNLALNELRRRRRHSQNAPAALSADEHQMAAIPDPAANPDEAAWDNARRARLTYALDELAPPQREIIALYATGHSQSEIATRLDQPLGTVKTRMRRGLLQLREILRRDGYDLE